MAYWFFFSYAHADYNDYLGTFYRDLEGEVRQLTGDPLAGIGFLDRKDIEHGATWDATLERGLKNCKVFVPLYSPSYFRALYCGKEFAVFRERLHDFLLRSGAAVADSLILPVLWNPEDNVLPRIPPAINKIQYKHGGYPAPYLTAGVSQMVKLGVAPNTKYYNEYWDFVREFAKTIVMTVDKLVLPPHTTTLTPLADVHGPFPTVNIPGESGPRYVQFIFVAGNQSELQAAQRKDLKFYGQQGGSDWQPYLDKYKGTATALAIEAIEAVSKDLRFEPVALSKGIVEQVRLAASQDKIVVVMIDTWTLQDPKYSQWMAPLDTYSSVNCITLITWNEDDQEATLVKGQLEDAVKAAFTTKVEQSPSNFLHNKIKSYDTFKIELIKALGQAQADIVAGAVIKRELPLASVTSSNAEFGTKPSF
jgi:FxsC-like protein